MIDDCHIRPFKAEDLPRLHEIRKAAFETVFASFRDIVGEEIAPVAFADAEQEQAKHLDKITTAKSDAHVFVVEHKCEIIAFCSIALDHSTKIGEIDLNAVIPGHQGHGVGAWMYDHALEVMKDAGMIVATVGTGGDESHAPARRAYEKAGFGPSIPSQYFYKSL